MSKSLATLFMLTAAAILSGCADDPPAGEFTLTPGPLSAEGTVEIAYQEFEDPLNQASGPDDPLCTLRPPEAGASCVPPSSSFQIDFPVGSLPAPDPGAPYAAYHTNAAGDQKIGDLQAADGAYSLNHTFESYLGGDPAATVQVRMGDVTIATAPATEGIQTFAPATALRQVSGEGSFEGKEFRVQVSGVPQNSTLVGWFVMEGEGGDDEHVISFSIVEGENTHMAEQNVADYDAFHIHLGKSAINVAVAPLDA